MFAEMMDSTPHIIEKISLSASVKKGCCVCNKVIMSDFLFYVFI